MPGAEDVWTISTCLREEAELLEGNQVITWSVRATSDYGSVIDLDAAWRAALPNLMNQMVVGVKAVGAFYRQHLPTPSATVGIKFPTPIAGGVFGQPLPLASCALILRRSGMAGRNSNGRLFLPWLPIQYEEADIPNRLVDVNRLGLQQACYDTNAALEAGGTGSSWTSVIVSRRSLSTPGVYATPVESWHCMPDFRALAQRGRRTYRCPFEDAWLAITPFNSFAKRRSIGFNWSNSGSNPLGWRYWLNNGARGGDDGTPDPTWNLPTFAGTTWHVWNASLDPGVRRCPHVNGPGGMNWPILFPNANANDPPGFELVGKNRYSKIAPAVPNAGDHYVNAGELDYYRCRFKVTNVPLVRSATLFIEHLDGAAHYINGTEVWNDLGHDDNAPPGCRTGTAIDILPYLLYENQLNCWGVIHQPQGVLGTSEHRWDRYPEKRPPDYDIFDSWWAGEIRIGGSTE